MTTAGSTFAPLQTEFEVLPSFASRSSFITPLLLRWVVSKMWYCKYVCRKVWFSTWIRTLKEMRIYSRRIFAIFGFVIAGCNNKWQMKYWICLVLFFHAGVKRGNPSARGRKYRFKVRGHGRPKTENRMETSRNWFHHANRPLSQLPCTYTKNEQNLIWGFYDWLVFTVITHVFINSFINFLFVSQCSCLC